MPWMKYDDQFDGNEKVVRAAITDLAAIGLHTLCGTASSRSKRPGIAPLAVVIAKAGSKQRAKKLAQVLVATGLWHAPGHTCERCEQPQTDEYVYHDWADFNPTGMTNDLLSAARSTAGKAGANSRWKNKQGKAA